MNKLPTDPNLPQVSFDKSYLDRLNTRLYEVYRNIAYLLNASASLSVAGAVNGSTAAPTTGTYFQGDFVRNTGVSEAGSASSKYVILGWVCVVNGTPGTWKECRCLTGN